jgi:AcrR family transcriptional regulator
LQKTKVRKDPGASPERRKRRSQDELTDRIIQAAAEEFKRAGYGGATTAAIARKAEVTEAQLFRYFGSKANLFRESVFKPLEEQLRIFTQEHLPDDHAHFKENTALYIESLRRFLSDNIDLITSLIVAETYEHEAADGFGAIASLGRYFDRGAATMGRWDRGYKVAPQLMVRVSFAAVLACVMFKDWILPPGLATEEEINNAIVDFVIEGLAANRDPAASAARP